MMSTEEYAIKNLSMEMKGAIDGNGGVKNMEEISSEEVKEVEQTCVSETGGSKNLEAKLIELETRVEQLESMVTAGGSKHGVRVITRKEMARWVMEAISKGDSLFGVSKCFIRKYLCEYHSLPQNNYYFRKLNTILSIGVEEKSLEYDKMHQLYKLV